MRLFRFWLLLALIITVMSGLVYAAVQQSYRQNANDPQVDIAASGALLLSAGTAPEALLPPNPIELSTSLSPFIMIFDDQGKAVGSSALLHGNVPTLPVSVLEYAKAHKQNRITWEPEKGIREAIIVVRYEGATPGYILAGRSLAEVESRAGSLFKLVALTWAGLLVVSGIAVRLL